MLNRCTMPTWAEASLLSWCASRVYAGHSARVQVKWAFDNSDPSFGLLIIVYAWWKMFSPSIGRDPTMVMVMLNKCCVAHNSSLQQKPAILHSNLCLCTHLKSMNWSSWNRRSILENFLNRKYKALEKWQMLDLGTWNLGDANWILLINILWSSSLCSSTLLSLLFFFAKFFFLLVWLQFSFSC